jgi:2-keto-4-pentenoate hydratase
VPLEVAGELPDVRVVLSRGGDLLAEGSGEAVLGHPAAAIAWLGDELGRRGEVLPAGQPLLAGSFTAAVDLRPGSYVADFGTLGAVSVEIAS